MSALILIKQFVYSIEIITIFESEYIMAADIFWIRFDYFASNFQVFTRSILNII